MPLPREIEVEPRRAFILERDTRSQEFTSSSFFTLFQKFHCVPWRKSLAEEKKLETVTTWKLYKDENHRMSRMAPRARDTTSKRNPRIGSLGLPYTTPLILSLILIFSSRKKIILSLPKKNKIAVHLFIYLFQFILIANHQDIRFEKANKRIRLAVIAIFRQILQNRVTMRHVPDIHIHAWNYRFLAN